MSVVLAFCDGRYLVGGGWLEAAGWRRLAGGVWLEAAGWRRVEGSATQVHASQSHLFTAASEGNDAHGEANEPHGAAAGARWCDGVRGEVVADADADIVRVMTMTALSSR